MPRRAVFASAFVLWPALFAAEPTIRFNRDVRPIMSNTCFQCHGPDARARMAGMRLDIRDEALKPTKSGGVPIVPGDPEKSTIIQRIFASNPARLMPPKHAHKDLTEAQKKIIRQWVAEGANYEGHWAYQPVKRPAVPVVASDARAPVRNAIDAFIQEKLKREGMQPSAEADKRTLIRRVTLDLTGIPPTEAEADAFLQDTSADAYEKLVDRLLSSPRYAEMQAMRWLDAVRYGDSAGFHGDNLWPAWPYRDYVLRAFRDNMPFDRFTREQLAGDLLPSATVDQKIASAYNRLNRSSAEGGLQPAEYLAKYGADRVRTTTTVWLGATMGCAECHDHKFDPFTAKDFYSMKAFFADIRETGLIPDRGVKAWGSKLLLPSSEQATLMAGLDVRIEAARLALKQKAESLKERRWQWEDELLRKHKAGELAWRYQRPVSASAANGATLRIYNDEPIESNFYLNGSLSTERKRGDGLIVASESNPDNETYTVQVKPGAGRWTAVGIDVYQDDSLPGNRVSRGADRFLLTEVEGEVSEPGGSSRKLQFVLATSIGIGEMPENGAMAAIDGDARTGWGVGFGEARNPFIALRLNEALVTQADSTLTLRLRHDSALRKATMGRFRVALSVGEHSWPEAGDSSRKARAKKPDPEASTLSVAVDQGLPVEILKALTTFEDDRTEEESKLVLEYFQWSHPELQTGYAEVAKLVLERSLVEAYTPRVLVTEATRPRLTRVLSRGNFLDESGEIVMPAVPAVFGTVGESGKRASRLDLANWIVSPENPLAARTFANRTWRQFFGTGISRVLEDLGSQGEWPTHPELLDWLAAEFMQPSRGSGTHAWDVKNLVRTIVTSHTYRQASLSSPVLDAKDPDNRLLARQSRFRVDAEVVHDIALSIAGLLNERFGGPTVRPTQPEGYLAAMNFPKREYSASRGEDQYRRAVYTQWQRTFLHPSLLTFDAPTREECTVNRVNSNTPQQALVLLNDPVFVESARVFAQRILAEGGQKLDGQIDWAFRRVLNRTPAKEERQIISSLYKRNLQRYKSRTDEAKQIAAASERMPELAAMTTVARTLLNLHETITRN